MSASNGRLRLECLYITSMEAQETRRSDASLVMTVRMTKAQMRAVVEQILEHVTEGEWAAWVEELSPGVVAELVKEARAAA